MCQSEGADFKAAAYDRLVAGVLAVDGAGVVRSVETASRDEAAPEVDVPAWGVAGFGVAIRVPSGVLALMRDPSDVTSKLTGRSSPASAGSSRPSSRIWYDSMSE
jgi:type IV secretory pathway TrbF-like protein